MTEPSPELIALAHEVFDLARDGHRHRLLELVDAGVPVDLTDPKGNTLLMIAAYHGHPGLVADLARRGADPDRLNDRGQSPLAGAVFRGSDSVVAVLLGLGADLDRGNPSARETAAAVGRSLRP